MTGCTCEMCQVLRATVLAEPTEAVSPEAIQTWLDLPRADRPPLWEWQRQQTAKARTA